MTSLFRRLSSAAFKVVFLKPFNMIFKATLAYEKLVVDKGGCLLS